MNKMIKKLLVFSLFAGLAFALPAMAMEEITSPYRELAKTISREELEARYSVSPELKSVIDINLPKNITRPKEFSWLPGFIMKHEQGRILGALLLRNKIREHECNLIAVPTVQSYLTKYDQRCSVERKIQISKEPFSLKQMKQFYKICKVTNYGDIHNKNILNSPEGIVYLVDIEQSSFMINGFFDKIDYLKLIKDLDLTPEANRWIEKKIAKHEKRDGKKVGATSNLAKFA